MPPFGQFRTSADRPLRYHLSRFPSHRTRQSAWDSLADPPAGNFSHAGLMQKGRLNPRPDFLNIVWPQTGQSSFTGTSKVTKEQVGELFAAVIVILLAGFLADAGALHEPAAAHRAAARHLHHQRLGEVALRPAGTGQEAAEPAGLDDQVPAAGSHFSSVTSSGTFR